MQRRRVAGGAAEPRPMNHQIILGDGIAGLESLPKGSASLVVSDPPWNQTKAPWDRPLNWGRWWAAIDHVLAAGHVLAVFGSVRLFLKIAPKAPRRFAYDMVWVKNRASNHLNAKRQPLRGHESIFVFGDSARGPSNYNPQTTGGHAPMSAVTRRSNSILYGRETVTVAKAGSTDRYSTTVLDADVVNNDASIRIHATQKPVPLLRWFVRAYTKPGELVVDPTVGSGSLIHACRYEGRDGIGWEIDPVQHDKSLRWLEGRDLPLFTALEARSPS